MRKIAALIICTVLAAFACHGCSLGGEEALPQSTDENFEAFLEISEEYHAEQAQKREEEANATPPPEPTTPTVIDDAVTLGGYEQPDMWEQDYDFGGFEVNVSATPTLPEAGICEVVKMRFSPFAKSDLSRIESLFNSGGLCKVESVGSAEGASEELVYGNGGIDGVRALDSGKLILPAHGGATVEILNLDSGPYLLYRSDFEAPGVDGMTPEDAEEMAVEAVSALGGDYLAPEYVYLGYVDGKEEPAYYGLEMRRVHDGINCAIQTEAINLGSAFFEWQSELVTIHVSNAGVTYLSWSGRMVEAPASGWDAMLLPFDDIVRSFEANAGAAMARYAPVMSGEAASPVAISRIALEYAYSDGDDVDSYVIKPVWAFYTDVEYAGQYSFAHYAALLIDAQTGEPLIAFPEEEETE